MASVGQKIVLMAFSMGVTGLAVYATCGMHAIAARYREAVRRLRRHRLVVGQSHDADEPAHAIEASVARDIWHCFTVSLTKHVDNAGESVPMATPQDVLKLRARLGSALDYLWRRERSLAGHVITVGFAGTLALASQGAFAIMPLLLAKKVKMPLAVHELFHAFGAALALMTFALLVTGAIAVFEYLTRQSLAQIVGELMGHIRGQLLLAPPRLPALPPVEVQVPAFNTAALEMRLDALQREIVNLAAHDPTAALVDRLQHLECRIPEDQLRALTTCEWRLPDDQWQMLLARNEKQTWRLPDDQMQALLASNERQTWRLPDDQWQMLLARNEKQTWRLPDDQMQALLASNERQTWRLPDDQMRLLMTRSEGQTLRLPDEQMRALLARHETQAWRLPDDQMRLLVTARELVLPNGFMDSLIAAQEKSLQKWLSAWRDERAGQPSDERLIEELRREMRASDQERRQDEHKRLAQVDEIVHQFDKTSQRFLSFLEGMGRRDGSDKGHVESRMAADAATLTPTVFHGVQPEASTMSSTRPDASTMSSAWPKAPTPPSFAWDNPTLMTIVPPLPGHEGIHDETELSPNDHDESKPLGFVRLRAGVALMKELWQELAIAVESMQLLHEQFMLLQQTMPSQLRASGGSWREAKQCFTVVDQILAPTLVLARKLLGLLRLAWHETFADHRLFTRDGVTYYRFLGDETPLSAHTTAVEHFWTNSPMPAQAALVLADTRKAMAQSLKLMLETQSMLMASPHGIDDLAIMQARVIRSLHHVDQAWQGWHAFLPPLKAFLRESWRRSPEGQASRSLAS